MLVIAAMALTLGISHSLVSQKICSSLSNELNTLDISSQSQVSDFAKHWGSKSTYLLLFYKQEIIDQVDDYVDAMVFYSQGENLDFASFYKDKILKALGDLGHSGIPTWNNVF